MLPERLLLSCKTGWTDPKSQEKGVTNLLYFCAFKNFPQINHYFGIGRLDISKMSILPKWTCRVHAILIKTFQLVFWEIDKLIPNIIWKYERSRTAKTFLKKRDKVEALILLEILSLFLYCKQHSKVWYWGKERQTDGHNKTCGNRPAQIGLLDL